MSERKITPAAARVNARIRQKKAAGELGIDPATLRNYENGSQVPPWDIVQKMEELYNWPASLIFFGSNLALSEIDSPPAE